MGAREWRRIEADRYRLAVLSRNRYLQAETTSSAESYSKHMEKNLNSNNSKHEGYIYCSDLDVKPPDVLFEHAQKGDVIGSGIDKPPYIVLDFNLSKVIIRWPGRLWHAQSVTLATDQPRLGWHYIRATSVRVIKELPVSLLFGDNGQAVVEILNRAHQDLDIVHKNTLRTLKIPFKEHAKIYSAVINRWLQTKQEALYHAGKDHRYTLGIVTEQANSPVGMALSVVYDIVRKRAQILEPDTALVSDGDEEDPEMILHPDWSAVSEMFLNAVMAVGAPMQLITPEEKITLYEPYKELFG